MEDQEGTDIEALMKPQHETFRKEVAQDMNFHDDLFVQCRGERCSPYVVTERKTRYIMKFGITKVDYSITIKRIVEAEPSTLW